MVDIEKRIARAVLEKGKDMAVKTFTGDETKTSIADTITFCLFKDIHKGIRNDLFAVTLEAGNCDPNDTIACASFADHVRTVHAFLETHAEHEDKHIGPSLEAHLPDLYERMEGDHHRLDAQVLRIAEMGDELDACGVVAKRRAILHHMYLESAMFTASYLPHQDMEERTLMPALEAAIGFDDVLRIHLAILDSIPPQEMAQSLALMLPAMNIEDRVELLTPVLTDAPPEIAQGVIGLTRSVLKPADWDALTARLSL